VPEGRDVMDFADPLIVKGADFATAITTHRLRKDITLKGVNEIKKVNEEIHGGVRKVMIDGGVFPEKLPPAPDVKEIESRLDRRRAKLSIKNDLASGGP
jgi:DNA-damage-inducible protein D